MFIPVEASSGLAEQQITAIRAVGKPRKHTEAIKLLIAGSQELRGAQFELKREGVSTKERG